MLKPKVVLEGLVKLYSDVEAVKGVDLTVSAGEFLTLLGPSGCGKTTTLNMIAGFEYPSAGRIWLDGVDVTQQPPFVRSVNTVFQNYALFPHMSVFDNVAFGLRVQRTPRTELRERVRQALALVQMEAFAERDPKQLSGGQQQRVALARALVLEPQVLLLDEPLGALDLKLRKEMQVELKHLHQRLGVTFIFVTHDQEEALSLSNRIAVMNGGRIEQIGTPEQIYERPQTRFVASFIGETNWLPASVETRGPDETAVNVAGVPYVLPTAEVPNVAEVAVSIRPERVRLVEPGHGPGLAAWVIDRIYVGADVRVIARTDAGDTVVAEDGPGTPLGRVKPGDLIKLTWEAADCVVLPAGEGVSA